MKISRQSLNLKAKSLQELQRLRAVLVQSEEDWSHSLAELQESQHTRDRELLAKLQDLQAETQECKPLSNQVDELAGHRIHMTKTLQDLKKQLDDIIAQWEQATMELELRKGKAKQLETEVRSIKAALDKDKASIPQLLANYEEVQSIVHEVEALIAASKTHQTVTSDELAQQQEYLFNMLCGGGAAPLSTSAMEPSLSAQSPPSCLSLGSLFDDEEATNRVSDDDEQEEEDDRVLVDQQQVKIPSSKPVRSSAGDQVVTVAKRARTDSSEKSKRSASSDPVPQRSFREEVEEKLDSVRQIFHTQRAKDRSSEPPVVCVRQDGRWRPTDEDKQKYKLVGYQGTKNAAQGFFVRFKNQVMSQKLLDTNCAKNDRVEAVFADPRDVSDIYAELTELFSSSS